MIIEVVWETKPKSGITEIALIDLGCKNKKQWDALDKKQQEERINEALVIYDGDSLKALAKEW